MVASVGSRTRSVSFDATLVLQPGQGEEFPKTRVRQSPGDRSFRKPEAGVGRWSSEREACFFKIGLFEKFSPEIAGFPSVGRVSRPESPYQ